MLVVQRGAWCEEPCFILGTLVALIAAKYTYIKGYRNATRTYITNVDVDTMCRFTSPSSNVFRASSRRVTWFLTCPSQISEHLVLADISFRTLIALYVIVPAKRKKSIKLSITWELHKCILCVRIYVHSWWPSRAIWRNGKKRSIAS